jgi:membrane-associated phospholipid phosphatase
MMAFDIHWYLNQQKKLSSQPPYKSWWIFWSIYSQAFLMGYGIYLLLTGQLFFFIIFTGTWVIARVVVAEIISLLYKKPRPYQRYGFKTVSSWFFSMPDSTPDSFPSGHTTGLMAVSVLLLFYHPVVASIGFVITALTAVGRVVLGYHFPLDIIGAIVIGGVWGYAAYQLVPYLIPFFL